MAYDIPDKIQYKEKIVFNLTLKQLIYAVVFALLAYFSYSLPIHGDEKLALPLIFCILGSGFAWLNWEAAILDRLSFFTSIRHGGAMDKHIQDFIGIKKIENDNVYLSNGQLRSIISVKPINIQNMDKAKKDGIKQNYRDFLNQLAHPIQILVRTVNVDLGEYFTHHDNRVEKTNNPQLIQLYNEFKKFEQAYLNENKVKERLYYIIIPYDPSNSLQSNYKSPFQTLYDKIQILLGKPDYLAIMREEDSCKELTDRTTIIQQKLMDAGLVSRRLSSNELISLYMSYFDGYAEVDEDYLSRYIVAEEFIKRRKNDGKTP